MKARQLFISAAMAAALSLLLVPVVLMPSPRLIYNPSPSAEIGWYRVDPGGGFEAGELVASWLPVDVREFADERGYLPNDIPVIKTVGAMAGDQICRTEEAVTLPNGTVLSLRNTDGLGRPLPQRQTGCFQLSDETVSLVSTRIETSFDSRYIGGCDVQVDARRDCHEPEEAETALQRGRACGEAPSNGVNAPTVLDEPSPST